MRKKDTGLQNRLLDFAGQMISEKGIDALTIRSLAQRADVAAGTVYNYFINKDDILLALTERYWQQTLTEMDTAVSGIDFISHLEAAYQFLQERITDSAGRLMESLGNVEPAGLQRMSEMQRTLQTAVLKWLADDPQVRADVWNGVLMQEYFADFVILNITTLLQREAPDMKAFGEIIRRIIY